jgi:hypothetical protein
MQNRDTEGFHHSATGCPVTFDERKLGRDVLSVISRLFAEGEGFHGHDGRQYVIIGINSAKSESESFIDVFVRVDDGRKVLVKYAIVLQRISR